MSLKPVELTCRNCGGMGHIHRACPSPELQNRCGCGLALKADFVCGRCKTHQHSEYPYIFVAKRNRRQWMPLTRQGTCDISHAERFQWRNWYADTRYEAIIAYPPSAVVNFGPVRDPAVSAPILMRELLDRREPPVIQSDANLGLDKGEIETAPSAFEVSLPNEDDDGSEVSEYFETAVDMRE